MVSLLAAAFVLGGRVQALLNLATLLQEDRLVGNFRSTHEHIPSRAVPRADATFEFERDELTLPRRFVHEGSERDFEEFLARRVTTGLLVIHDDRIVLERYDLGNDESSHTISWSVCKSFVSALVGIAISEGAIGSVDDRVSDYVPELVGSGYEGVPLKHVLQMSSGIRFREDYGDPSSDINRMGRALAFGTPLAEFVAGLRRERPSGEYNHYVSMDTQVIGMVLARATGRSLSEYLEEKIWRRIGTESDAWWLLDEAGGIGPSEVSTRRSAATAASGACSSMKAAGRESRSSRRSGCALRSAPMRHISSRDRIRLRTRGSATAINGGFRRTRTASSWRSESMVSTSTCIPGADS